VTYDYSMGATTQTLYETDFAEWADRTAELLRARRLGYIDGQSVVEEIETLGRSNARGPLSVAPHVST